jgi:hypothetical protein
MFYVLSSTYGRSQYSLPLFLAADFSDYSVVRSLSKELATSLKASWST